MASVMFPPHFSWVVEDLLAAMAYPASSGHVQYLLNHGIKTVVSLTETVPPALSDSTALIVVHIGIEDFTPPTMHQVEQFINLMEDARQNKEAVVVHCAHGRGRTGTVIACYLMKLLGITAEAAIIKIRQFRPGSIETTEQEKLVQEYEKVLKSV